MKKIAPLASAVLLLVLASCVTTKGALVNQTVSPGPPPQSSSTVQVQPSSSNPEQTGLEIETTPADAQVYINDAFIGDTPLLYSNFSAGTYKITITKRGYYDSVRWLSLDPTSYTLLQTNLTPKVGYLYVEATPSTAKIRIDGLLTRSGIHQLPVGLHAVRITAFGYETFDKSVDVQENQTTNVRAKLSPAKFRISDLTTSKRLVSPLNPAPLGTVRLTFNVSTYGSGKLVITNSNGTEVFAHSFARYTDREQSVVWTGRNQDGAIVPDGAYRVTASGRETPSSTPSSESISVTVARGALIGLRSTLSGTSGLLFAGTPEVLPPSSYSVSGRVLAVIGEGTVPVQAGFRAVPHRGIELDGQASVELTSANTSPYSLSVAAKFGLTRPPGRDGFSAAVSVKGTYLSGTTSDLFTNFTGLSVGFPVEYRFGPLGLVFMPEITGAPYAPYSGAVPAGFTPTFWAYGRSGVFLDFGSIVTGASLAVRTEPFGSGFGLSTAPLAAGWEIHWLIPQTQLVLNGEVIGESDPSAPNGFSIMTGAGIGFVN